jgi:hypothetical protein
VIIRRRHAPPLGLALGIVWVAIVTLLVARMPEPGAADPAALARDFQRAVAARDATAVERLLADPSTGTAHRLLDEARCGDRPAVVRPAADHLELSGVDGSSCGRLPIAEQGGRWYLASTVVR